MKESRIRQSWSLPLCVRILASRASSWRRNVQNCCTIWKKPFFNILPVIVHVFVSIHVSCIALRKKRSMEQRFKSCYSRKQRATTITSRGKGNTLVGTCCLDDFLPPENDDDMFLGKIYKIKSRDRKARLRKYRKMKEKWSWTNNIHDGGNMDCRCFAFLLLYYEIHSSSMHICNSHPKISLNIEKLLRTFNACCLCFFLFLPRSVFFLSRKRNVSASTRKK